MKFITKLIPNPVNRAYMMSLTDAAMPVMKPYQRPLFSVRCMQSTPTGPIGADAMMPIRIPLKMKSNMSICIGNCIMSAKLQILCDIDKFSLENFVLLQYF